MLQLIINSLLMGGIYGLVASGFSLVWGVMNIINMTHGSLMMLGAYITFFLWQMGMDPLLATPISMIVMYLVGYLLQFTVINRIVRAPVWMTLVLTFGLNLLIVNLAIFFFSATPRSVVVKYGSLSIRLGETMSFPLIKLVAFGPALALILGLFLFVGKTKTGRAIQATRMDPEIAAVMGVKIKKVYAITFGIGSALAAAAGSIISIYSSISPNMGLHYTAIAFVVCVLGGLGNIKAVIPAGIILGFLESWGGFILGSSYEAAIAYTTLLIILTIIPNGLFGKKYY